ncbi:hypothetical protein AAIG39_09035 [Phytobacter palmae]|uniref:Uncharacterized protein n=1 Tax=Phytobacter palmae TaxID=1855371 RepID=A0ABU9V3E1_9ENTR
MAQAELMLFSAGEQSVVIFYSISTREIYEYSMRMFFIKINLVVKKENLRHPFYSSHGFVE